MPIRYDDIITDAYRQHLKSADVVPAIGIDKIKNSRYRIVNIDISAISSTAL